MTASQYLENFTDKIRNNKNGYDLKILHHETLNVYFPNDQCVMIQNHAWMKDLTHQKQTLGNFNVTSYEISVENGFRFHTANL